MFFARRWYTHPMNLQKFLIVLESRALTCEAIDDEITSFKLKDYYLEIK